jgi:hypothetical protein
MVAQRFRRAVGEAQLHGFATEREEYEAGICCVGVALRRSTGRPVAVSITGPSTRMGAGRLDDLGRRLREVLQASAPPGFTVARPLSRLMISTDDRTESVLEVITPPHEGRPRVVSDVDQSCPPRHQPVVFEHVDPMLRVKRSRASAPHRREPPGTGDALRMKSGHESETTRAGHNVRRAASVQFSAPHVDIRFEKLQLLLMMV